MKRCITNLDLEFAQTQLVGSIQMTNDLDVHVALLTAPSYQKHMVSVCLFFVSTLDSFTPSTNTTPLTGREVLRQPEDHRPGLPPVRGLVWYHQQDPKRSW